MKTSSSLARHSVVVSLPQPMYAQIKDELRRRILDGSYTVHQQLPSESELTQLFKVSRITVRQALNDLQKEGLIFRIHGKGTYVSKPKAFQELGKLEGFAEAMGRHGYETFNRLLSIHNIAPAAPVAARLSLPKSRQVTELRRVRYLNRSPSSLDSRELELPKESSFSMVT
jgi:GntR family transcriptional regulator